MGSGVTRVCRREELRASEHVAPDASTHVVQLLLLGGVHPDHHGPEDVVHVLDGSEDTLAAVARAAVAELARLAEEPMQTKRGGCTQSRSDNIPARGGDSRSGIRSGMKQTGRVKHLDMNGIWARWAAPKGMKHEQAGEVLAARRRRATQTRDTNSPPPSYCCCRRRSWLHMSSNGCTMNVSARRAVANTTVRKVQQVLSSCLFTVVATPSRQC